MVVEALCIDFTTRKRRINATVMKEITLIPYPPCITQNEMRIVINVGVKVRVSISDDL